MKTHRMLIITSVVLVTLLITTGVALAHAGAVYNTAEGDFSTVSGGRNNNISDPDSLVTTQEDNKFTQGVRIPNIPSGTQASRAVTRDLEATAGQPPPPPSKPQLQQAQFPLDLVVFNNAQANFFLNNPQWVHPGDKFMIGSANAFSGDNEDYNSTFVNNTARRLLARFPQTEVRATTSGRRNTRTAINTVNRNLIDIVMTVWEPNNPDFPTDAFNRNDSETVNRVTRNFAQEMTNLAHNRGLEYWMKPTGRSTI